MKNNFIINLLLILVVVATIGIIYQATTIIWGVLNGESIKLIDGISLYLSCRLIYLELFKHR